MEQEQVDRLRFTRMQKTNEFRIKDILKVPIKQRSSTQNFFLRMHLQDKVPFFGNYSGQVLENIASQLHQRVYDRDEIIIKKGDFGDELYVVMVGEVGVYIDDSFR